MNAKLIKVGKLVLEVKTGDGLFTFYNQSCPETLCRVLGPSFEVNGQARSEFNFNGEIEQQSLTRGGSQWSLTYGSKGSPELTLKVILRAYPNSQILRMRYELTSAAEAFLTKTSGKDNLVYLRLDSSLISRGGMHEVQLSHFDPVRHSYLPDIVERDAEEVLAGMSMAGPAVVFEAADCALLAAYEHGADHPDSFLNFIIQGERDEKGLALQARRGNYFSGQSIGAEKIFASVWFELGLMAGSYRKFLQVYRQFFLEEVCENNASRQPHIYYNTWNYQERQRYFYGRPFLESMTEERILAEIEVAHQMGVDVFVIDTGWYIKTGDWLPNTDRFHDGLKTVKHKLDEYGMQLGLWFNPTVAALTSRIYLDHPEYEMTHLGKPVWRGPVWETEESTGMCLASGYADDYIETMVRLNLELGVTYFKWDGISQYGCDSALHDHGTEANSPEERADCYAYQMGRQMIRIVMEVTRRCPGVIVDFDITEGGRFVGLGFLSVGKYFLINNGPYFQDFNIPATVKIEPNTINVFFYPGAARPRICRQGVNFDKVIPSILFLTHYLPDAPLSSQENNLASLVLGGNGLWGDLLGLSTEDLAFWHTHLSDYKRVAPGVTRAYPRQQGFAGSSPEIYEKVDPETGCGVVVFITVTPGEYIYFTQPVNPGQLEKVKGADSWSLEEDGRIEIGVKLGRDGARVVYIFGKEQANPPL